MISINNKKLANAVGSKTARACDSCIKKRARWYCASDDAFLCQSCDATVHSANPLARRHERLRLKAASLKSLDSLVSKRTAHRFCDVKIPSWHQGFKRKARTPRHGKSHSAFRDAEDGYDPVSSFEETEDDAKLPQVYRVPVFYPFVNGIEPMTFNCRDNDEATRFTFNNEAEEVNIKEFLTTEMDLAEYEADVGMLLEKEFEFSLNEPCKEENFYSESKMGIKIKLEALDETCEDRKGPMSLDFEDEKKTVIKMGFCLRLDHEAVISAWAAHGGSPWTTGARPNVDVDDSWPEYPGSHGVAELARLDQETRPGAIWANPCDGGREARVSRYREKRRTRLFSKKIRYEVRKLNAEKRPRMKGRFIKRTSFEPPPQLLR